MSKYQKPYNITDLGFATRYVWGSNVQIQSADSPKSVSLTWPVSSTKKFCEYDFGALLTDIMTPIRYLRLPIPVDITHAMELVHAEKDFVDAGRVNLRAAGVVSIL